MTFSSNLSSGSIPEIPSFILERKSEFERVCVSTGVAKIWLFGSALRDDFDPAKSDLDFLVEFDTPDAAGISDRYFTLAENLEKIFQRPVDLITTRSIKNHVFADQVSSSIRPLYAA